jgi:hypothetical protein
MDRDRLAFGDDIVELDEKRRHNPCRRREHRDPIFIFIASTNATSSLPATLSPTSTGNTADASLRDDLKFWHANRLFVVVAGCLR